VARYAAGPIEVTEEHTFMATTTFPTRDDFAALLNESLGGENETFEGKVVKGTVTAIENDMAVIDVGLKSEGRVALREFAAPGQKAELAIGDEVEVYVDRVENSAGEAMLSRDRARREAAWDKLEKEFEAGNRVGFHVACTDCHARSDAGLARPSHAVCARCHAPEVALARSVWTIGSATPKRLTRRSITCWRAPRASPC